MSLPNAPIRVVHMTTVHKSDDVRIFHKECVSLASAGYQVHLLQRDQADRFDRNVRITALRTFGSRLRRMTQGVWEAYRHAVRLKPALVHFHDAELIPAGLMLKFSGIKVIYDVHEALAKDLHDKAYLPRWSIAPLSVAVRAVEWLAERCFDRMVCATASIHQQFDARRAVLVRNTPILGELSKASPTPFRDRPRQIVYLGGLAPFNGVEQMIRALDHVGTEDFRLVLGGNFPDATSERRLRALSGWKFIDYVGWVSREQVAEHFARSRAALVVYQPTPNVMDSEPNKFFEVMSAGLPLIASDFPVWSSLLELAQSGWAINPTDPAAIGAAIRWFLDNPDQAEEMGKRGQRLIEDTYNWAIDEKVLVATYADLVGAPCR
jgi:glycosyltransferase involved in cell wall biosynthesis